MDTDTLLARKVRVGVTGFSKAGKTVFICALAQALLTADAWRNKRGQGPLAGFGPFDRGQFSRARINHRVGSDGLPEFPLESVRDALVGNDSRWPSHTAGISRLTVDLASDSKGWSKSILRRAFGSLGSGVIQLELIDYPGEWLIDLPMLSQNFGQWSKKALGLAKGDVRHDLSEPYFAWLSRTAPGLSNTEVLDEAARLWAGYLNEAASAGLSFNQPGMAVCPDSTRDPALFRLAPLPAGYLPQDVLAEMQKRFERYKKKVVKPFYKNHFALIDRQIVLVDLLRVLEAGKGHYDDLLAAQRALLPSFNYSRGGPLDWIGGVRTTRVLFAATKADHVVKGDRRNLADLLKKMLCHVDADKVLRWSTDAVDTMALCSVRATEDRLKKPWSQEVLLGRPADEPEDGYWDPNGLPLDIPPDWDSFVFRFFRFEPRPMPKAHEVGFPSIHLGRALHFLIGGDFK